jgi:hypothetical protein
MPEEDGARGWQFLCNRMLESLAQLAASLLLATWSTALIEAHRALRLKLPGSTC